MSSERSRKYRPDIDGVRAISVVAVVLFHANQNWLPGGFLGVDVFFCISGFLITKIILESKKDGNFSLANFWEMRIRRIFPALYLMMISTFVASTIFFDPSELKSFAESSISTILFAANFFFWKEIGFYFSPTTDQKMMVHTWSLSVEEQFYAIYPIFVGIVLKYFRRYFEIIVCISAITSFVLAEFASGIWPAAAFFFPVTRAWELLTGAIFALPSISNCLRHTLSMSKCSFLANVALLVIGLSFVFLGGGSHVPGLRLVPVILGTSLLLLFGDRAGGFASLTASRPLVFVGLMSYSLYLWHVPLLAGLRVISPTRPSSFELLGALALSFVFGWLSFRFVEGPFRDACRVPRAALLKAAGAVGLCLVGFNLVLAGSGGLPERLDSKTQKIAKLQEEEWDSASACFFSEEQDKRITEACRVGSGPMRMLFLGDSHGMAIRHAFASWLFDKKAGGLLAVAGGCPPLTNLNAAGGKRLWCPLFTRRVLAYVKEASLIDTVVIAARWPYYFHRSHVDTTSGGIPAPIEKFEPSELRPDLISLNFRKVVDELLAMGKRVVLVYPVPELDQNVIRYLVHSKLRGQNVSEVSMDWSVVEQRQASARLMLDGLGTRKNLIRLDPALRLCNVTEVKRCVGVIDGLPLYFDSHHLTKTGAEFALPKKVIDDALN